MKTQPSETHFAKSSFGVALLEAGAWLAVVSFLLVGAIAWGARANDQADLETIVRNEARRSGVNTAVIDADGTIVLNTSELSQRLSTTIQNVVTHLRQNDFDGDLNVKACYWVVPTEVTTGKAQFDDAPVCTVFGSGEGIFSASEMPRIERWFEGVPAAAAIPFQGMQSLRFAEFSVVLGLGVRAESRLPNNLWEGLPGTVDYSITFLPSGDIGL